MLCLPRQRREALQRSCELRGVFAAGLGEIGSTVAKRRAMLADIYNWFSEGFDTADLIDAKALLDKLKTAQVAMATEI